MFSSFDLLLLVIVAVVFGYGFYRRYRLWTMGKPEKRTDQPKERLKSVWAYVFGHKRMLRDPYQGWMHLLIFYGFLIPFVVVVITQANFSLPRALAIPLSLFFEFVGTLGIVGILMAAYRRYVQKPENATYDSSWGNLISLLLLLGIFVLGFCVEGLRIARTQPGWADWTPVGWIFSQFFSGLSEPGQILLHRVLWRLHLFLVLGFIAFLPYSRMLHIVTAPANVYFRSLAPKGELQPIRDFENAETFGASKLEELSWKQLFDLDACTRCGRCLDHCPGAVSGKPLAPKKNWDTLRAHMEERGGSQAKGDRPRRGRGKEADRGRGLRGCDLGLHELPGLRHGLSRVHPLRGQIPGDEALSRPHGKPLPVGSSAGLPEHGEQQQSLGRRFGTPGGLGQGAGSQDHGRE